MALGTYIHIDFCTGERILADLNLPGLFCWVILLPLTQIGEEIVYTFIGEQRLE